MKSKNFMPGAVPQLPSMFWLFWVWGWKCLCLVKCECVLPSGSVVAPGECDSAISCISSLNPLDFFLRSFKYCLFRAHNVHWCLILLVISYFHLYFWGKVVEWDAISTQSQYELNAHKRVMCILVMHVWKITNMCTHVCTNVRSINKCRKTSLGASCILLLLST